jgi:hypothetical protein
VGLGGLWSGRRGWAAGNRLQHGANKAAGGHPRAPFRAGACARGPAPPPLPLGFQDLKHAVPGLSLHSCPRDTQGITVKDIKVKTRLARCLWGWAGSRRMARRAPRAGRAPRRAAAVAASSTLHLHLTQALGMVAVTGPWVVIMGTPRYTHTPSAGSGGRRRGGAGGRTGEGVFLASVNSEVLGSSTGAGAKQRHIQQRAAPSPQPAAPSPRRPASDKYICQRTCIHPQLGGNLFKDLPLGIELRLRLLAIPAVADGTRATAVHVGEPVSVCSRARLPYLLQHCACSCMAT